MSDEVVRWAEMLPEEFEARLKAMPIVYLPIGLCEPHGHIAPFGLDTIKADYLCDTAARRFGGIVAPTMGYHIHETGYHAPWLKEVMGGVNPRLAALPPHVLLETFLYQLRAFRNAGFKAVVAISGHHGGNQFDLRMVANAFVQEYPIECFVCSDPELVEGAYIGDHAGKYEISQLLYIQPEIIKLEREGRMSTDILGRFAQNADATEASGFIGRDIIERSLAAIGKAVATFSLVSVDNQFICMKSIEPLWDTIRSNSASWKTLNE